MTEKVNEIERLYIIPLRREWVNEPRSKRCNRAIRDIKEFVKKHAKTKHVSISQALNELIFSRGFQKPPGKIKVLVKGDKERVTVQLPSEETKIKKEGIEKGVENKKETKNDKKEKDENKN
ncbi:MAG: 50S ribosomal protein L31e [Candidatus Aenigmatarchaeota archaeon]